MSTRPIGANTNSVDFQTSPSKFNVLSKKTDITARKNKHTEYLDKKFQSTPTFVLCKKTDTNVRKKLSLDQSSPPFNKNKRLFDADFPSSSDTSAENSRISKIAFPVSPMKEKLHQNRPSVYGNRTANNFAIPLALVSAGSDAVVNHTEILSMPLPKPDFSYASQLGKIETKLVVQQTPIKRARAGSVISSFQKLHEALLANTFKYKVTYLGKGSYSNAYTLENNADPIIAGVNNSDLVLKAYHGEKSGFLERKLRAFLCNQIKNYYAVIAQDLPVAPIYNADTAEQDGYIIQHKVSGKVDPLDVKQLLQVSRFFDVSVTKCIIMDPQLQNFGLENRVVVLFDFTEDPDDDDELHPFNKKVIEDSWLVSYKNTGIAKDQAEIYLNTLTANHYQEFVQELLNK
jgi:hypothetical protein